MRISSNEAQGLEEPLAAQLQFLADQEKQASTVGNNLAARERELLELYAAGEIENPETRTAWLKDHGLDRYLPQDGSAPSPLAAIRDAVQVTYKEAGRMYEYFQVNLQNFFQTMKVALQNLRVS